ncbi:helix-turn-helix domain-containing protein [bacterium]|nr:helix-turn-helix domain-containing protein [bacterium]
MFSGELEKEHILRVLKLVSSNKSRAAELLGIDRRSLHRKMKRWAEVKGT